MPVSLIDASNKRHRQHDDQRGRELPVHRPRVGHLLGAHHRPGRASPAAPGRTTRSARSSRPPLSNNNNEDHGVTIGTVIQTAPLLLGTPGTNPDNGGLANLRQDFGLFPLLTVGQPGLVYDANNNGKLDAGENGPAEPRPSACWTRTSNVGRRHDHRRGRDVPVHEPLPRHLLGGDRHGRPDLTSSTGTPNSAHRAVRGWPPARTLPENTNDSEDKGNTLAGRVGHPRQRPVTLLAFGDNPDFERGG